jgi:formate dehydrogenase subunit beta
MFPDTSMAEREGAMDTSWLVETHGDPLGVIQTLIKAAWERFELDTLMLSMNGSTKPHLINDPEQLDKVNPFKPLMTKNAAKYLPQVLEDIPNRRVGVVLRPCEMRALVEKTKREALPMDRVLTICVDCLGTYPMEDYQWRSERKGSPDRLAWESLHFARQGGIAAYRFRSACQACRTPIGHGADVNIGVIGLPVRQKIYLDTIDSETAITLGREEVTSEEDQSLIDQRNYIIAKLLQRGTHTRQRLADNLESILPRDIDALLHQFERCGECRECFDNCPLCAADYPAKDELGMYAREDVKQWMISCAGCGMCEQACPSHLPLVTIFTQIRQQLIDSIEPALPIH